MASLAFTVTIPQDRIEELRALFVDLHHDTSGLVDRAKAVGYHREHMWLQLNDDRSGQLITYLELDPGVDPADFAANLMAYESPFTQWFNPRYFSFLGRPPTPSEPLFGWDDEQA